MNKEDKIELIKGISSGKINPDVSEYLLQISKDPNCIQIFVTDSSGKLLKESEIKKELYDRLPEKYKKIFTAVCMDEDDFGIGHNS